jgi:hypothetical protein
LSSARWLFLPDGPAADRSAFPADSLRGMKVHRNPGAVPRANVVFSSRVFPGEEELLAFLETPGAFDPRRELAVLRRDAAAWNLRTDPKEATRSSIPPQATIVADRPDRIEIALEPAAPAEAFLVLSDTYHPGWRARVDGAETKIVRVDYAFRGIALPRGARHVDIFYDPLIPDAVLPLPTILLASVGGGLCLRRFAKGGASHNGG